MAETTTADDPLLIPAGVHFNLVGGKGGVGKTTCSAAMAVSAAAAGARTLVITTDPAPSLGDAFARRIGAAPTRITVPRGSLHAVEIDAARALERWLAGRRAGLSRMALRGTWLDEEDVARILRLSLPGIDEIAALLECVRLARSNRFDRIIVDTAPTGHALRMLTLPDTLVRLALLFDQMQEKHRVMVSALRGGWQPDEDDALLGDIHRDGVELAALLRDGERMTMSWVTLPERMAVLETADALAALAADGIGVATVIVNRLTPAPATRCAHCSARRAFEQQALAMLGEVTGEAAIVAVAARPAEPRGVAPLAAIGRELRSARSPRHTRRSSARPRPFTAATAGTPVVLSSALADPGTRLMMFGGKGGVGKTTCAAAAAIAIASRDPDKRVLLLSTDPAHSLADVLDASLSDDPRPVPGGPRNLRVRELDAARSLAAFQAKYAAALGGLLQQAVGGGSVDTAHDRGVLRGLLNVAPPGIDELVAVLEVVEALIAGDREFDLVVMDMAPSGHALRLLETPVIVQEWAKALMSMLLKYQPVVGVGELGRLLLTLSQGVSRLRDLLRHSSLTRFIVVSRAAALPREETARLVRQLRRLKVPVSALVVNAVGRGDCPLCRRAAAAERLELAALFAVPGMRSLPRLLMPTQVPVPQGAAGLAAWAGKATRI